MAKLTAMLIIALVICSTTLTFAARPIPASHHEDVETTEQHHMKVVDDTESCQGLNEDECLMRRTLVAHTDYIYTQQHNP